MIMNRIWKKIYYGVPNYAHYIASLCLIRKKHIKVKNKIASGKKINVIFIVQYIPAWNKLEDVYNKMKHDDRYNPYIICVPLKISDNVLDEENDTYEYFAKRGYDVINAIDNGKKWYDIKLLKPDYVFHSRPYNDYMPKCYSSRNIVKYALICNVLYGASLTVEGQQVTLNRDYFDDVFCYFAFDSSERLFYQKRFCLGCQLNIQKCYPYGATALEQMLREKKCDKINGFSKTILWTPRWSTSSFMGGSNFFNYVNVFIKLAKQHKNVFFIFRPHPLMFDNFLKTGEMTNKEVDEFKKYCQTEKNIMLDEEKEYVDTFWKSDILVTDGSGIVPEYLMTQRPIVYCHCQNKANWAEYAKAIIDCSYQVYNQEDLERYIGILLENNDYMSKERQDCLNQYFKDVGSNSSSILDVLAKP